MEEVADTLYVFSADGPIPEGLFLGHGTITHRQATLEDVFLRLTGKALVE